MFFLARPHFLIEFHEVSFLKTAGFAKLDTGIKNCVTSTIVIVYHTIPYAFDTLQD